MAEGGILSYGTHRYLIVHTWVGLKHSDTMEYTHREEGGREDETGGNGKININQKEIQQT